MAQMLINGEHVAAVSGEERPVINPATEEVIDTVPEAGAEDVERAVAAAKAAFRTWSRTDADERARLLRAGIERVKAQSKELAGLLTREQGKPLAEAAGEIHHLLHGLEFYADMASKIRGAYVPLPANLGMSYGMVMRRPVGVVAAITPFNFPLSLLGTKLGPALAAGCTIVVKPAETTPLSTIRLLGLLQEAGLPAGVMNLVTGAGPRVGEALVGHPDVARVTFTGGTRTGQRIMEIAGPRLKHVTLELGGSDPVIVCPDADIEKAVKGVVIGRYFNAGQACLAAKRIYVFDEVYEQFLDELLKRVSRYELGEGWTKAEKPKIRMGPLHTARGRETLHSQVQDALDRGARLVCGGGPPTDRERGFFYEPTVLVDAPHDSRVVQEETFGPVLPLFRVRTIQEAIRLANSSQYGLGSSVWTYNIKWIHKVAQEVEAGVTWVNQIHYAYDEVPFGGVKLSGLGREHGPEGLDAYLETKSVVVGDLDVLDDPGEGLQ